MYRSLKFLPSSRDWVKGVEFVWNRCGGAEGGDEASVHVNLLRDLVPDGGVAKSAAHRIPRRRHYAPFIIDWKKKQGNWWMKEA